MRSLIGYILIVLILFQSVGKTLTDSILCYIHKCEVQEKIRKQGLPLHQFHLTETEYKNSLVERNEIKLNGIMFDIESIEKVNGKLFIKAYEDKKETNLLAGLRKFIGKHAGAGKSALKCLKDSTSVYYSLLNKKSFYLAFSISKNPALPPGSPVKGYSQPAEYPPSIVI